MKRIDNVIKIIIVLFLEKTARIWPNDLYLKLRFRLNGGQYNLNLKSPSTFNEKLNWNKLFDHNPLWTKLADKYEVKQFVKEVIGEQYVVPNYAVWDKFEDINFDSLPNQFVLKSTHDSGGATICKDKSKIDIAEIKKEFHKVQKKNYYWPKREWVYKDIKPRIIADKLLDDHSGRELRDYKFLCFNGEPHYMYITNKGAVIEENFYNMNFQPVMIDHGFPRTKPEYEKPATFELMIDLCRKLLSKLNVSFVRIDFFSIDGKVYFGEFTFYDWAGLRPFTDIEWDKRLGSMIS